MIVENSILSEFGDLRRFHASLCARTVTTVDAQHLNGRCALPCHHATDELA